MSGVWLGVDLRMDNEKDMCLKRLDNEKDTSLRRLDNEKTCV